MLEDAFKDRTSIPVRIERTVIEPNIDTVQINIITSALLLFVKNVTSMHQAKLGMMVYEKFLKLFKHSVPDEEAYKVETT